MVYVYFFCCGSELALSPSGKKTNFSNYDRNDSWTGRPQITSLMFCHHEADVYSYPGCHRPRGSSRNACQRLPKFSKDKSGKIPGRCLSSLFSGWTSGLDIHDPVVQQLICSPETVVDKTSSISEISNELSMTHEAHETIYCLKWALLPARSLSDKSQLKLSEA